MYVQYLYVFYSSIRCPIQVLPRSWGSVAAQALVGLLVRLGRYSEAIEASLQHLADVDPSQLACPTPFQLCQLAGDHKRLMELARKQGDLLNYTAAALQSLPKSPRGAAEV